MFRSEREVLFW